jgi:hypothetical protein
MRVVSRKSNRKHCCLLRGESKRIRKNPAQTSGLVVTLLASRVMGSFLFGISARDRLTLVSVAPMLGCVAIVACAVPARRAARIDPAITLRSEWTAANDEVGISSVLTLVTHAI